MDELVRGAWPGCRRWRQRRDPAWTINKDGTTDNGGVNPATGYSVLSADSMQAASEMAVRCPVIAEGGSIELCEALEMG